MGLKKCPLNNKTLRALLLIFVFLLLIVLAWNIELFYYKPLADSDFRCLFPEYASVKKIYSHDALIQSIHGEAFELHHYVVNGATIKQDYPMIEESWDGYESQNFTLVSWTKELCGVEEFGHLPDKRITRRFYKHWVDNSNFRSYLSFSETRSYWFVYSPDTDDFYYLIFKL